MRLRIAVGRLLRDESGATAIEYGLICAMMAVVVITIGSTGGALEAIYQTVSRIVDAVSGANGDSGS